MRKSDSPGTCRAHVTRVTAALELAELLQAPGGRAVQYSINVFAPGTVDLHVIRGMAPASAQPTR